MAETTCQPQFEDPHHLEWLIRRPSASSIWGRMGAAVRTALASAGLTLADVGSDTSVTQLLLGSLPRTVASVLAGGDGLALRGTLRASAVFIQSVYHSRWTYGHKFGQSD